MSCATSAQPTGASNVHHDLHVTLDPAKRELRIDDTIDMVVGNIDLALSAQFEVEQLVLDGRPVIPKAESLPDGRTRWILEPEGPGSHRVFLRYRGHLAALPDADHRGTLQGLQPMADARGTFLPGSTGWYPELHAPSFTYRLTLDLPVGQRGLVPGRLVSEANNEQGYRAVFDFPFPAESIDLLAGPYEVQERWLPRDRGAPIRLRTWFHPEIADLAPGYLDAVRRYIELYSGWIGDYPFSEFSVVSSPLQTGFGMPTLTYLGIDVLRLPFIRSTSLGHEVLHNWWGNGVYVDYKSGNWSEGLTTFMADYTYKEQESAQAALDLRLSWLRDLAAVPPGQDYPLRDFTARTHGTSQIIGYHKAALVFLMLRDWLGTESFDRGLRNIWREQRFRRASWADLQHAFEESCGIPLGGFFEQWLTRAGIPQLRLNDARAEQIQTGLLVRVELAQTDPAYSLRVPLVVESAAGNQTRVVELSQPRREFALDIASAPTSVALDPDMRLARRLDAQELPPILRQVMLDAATVVFVTSNDNNYRSDARSLAEKLLDTAPRIVGANQPAPRAPLLLIGTSSEVDAFLEQRGLPPRPSLLRQRGNAQVWASTQPDGNALLVVSADDAYALQALQRPLPHYGRQSWLVFDGAKVIDRGVWPAKALSRPLH